MGFGALREGHLHCPGMRGDHHHRTLSCCLRNVRECSVHTTGSPGPGDQPNSWDRPLGHPDSGHLALPNYPCFSPVLPKGSREEEHHQMEQKNVLRKLEVPGRSPTSRKCTQSRLSAGIGVRKTTAENSGGGGREFSPGHIAHTYLPLDPRCELVL